MILVINLNASIDKRYNMTELTKGEVLRVRQVENTPGGKGLHVANVATILGEDCLVTGLLGGKSGEFIRDKITKYGIKQDFVEIAGETRSCLAIITADGAQTEILEPGPSVSQAEQSAFLNKYEKLIAQADIIVASGSLPSNVAKNFYRILIEMAANNGKKFLLDTSGEALQQGILSKPYFIKPNADEIRSLTGRQITTPTEVIAAVKEFMSTGICLAVVSLGAAGSIVGYQGKIYQVTVPKITAINPVGSGDAYVAGIATGLNRGYNINETIKLAAACGTANALEAESGFITKSTVTELMRKIIVTEILA